MKNKLKTKKALTAIIAILIFGCIAGICNASGILDISLSILDKGNVSGSIKVSIGSASFYRNYGTEYKLEVLDVSEKILWSKNYGLNFITLSDPPVHSNYELISEKIPYIPNMYELRLYKNEKILYRQYLDFCDNNMICDENENQVSCPTDCGMEYNDGICISMENGYCDPDCIRGIDPDCKTIENARERLNASKSALWIALLCLAAAGIYERKKIRQYLLKLRAKIKIVSKCDNNAVKTPREKPYRKI